MDNINPYSSADKLGWSMIDIEQPDLFYEFNILCFWKTPSGLVFTASDSGCSCPIPFENYEGETPIEIEQKLERVGSFDQAKRTFDAWNNAYDNRPYVSMADADAFIRQLEGWFK